MVGNKVGRLVGYHVQQFNCAANIYPTNPKEPQPSHDISSISINGSSKVNIVFSLHTLNGPIFNSNNLISAFNETQIPKYHPKNDSGNELKL